MLFSPAVVQDFAKSQSAILQDLQEREYYICDAEMQTIEQKTEKVFFIFLKNNERIQTTYFTNKQSREEYIQNCLKNYLERV